MKTSPVGPEWPTCFEKKLSEARVLDALGSSALTLAALGSAAMQAEGRDWVFFQERVGFGGKKIWVPKTQTGESTSMEYGSMGQLTPRAALVRDLALDELWTLARIPRDPFAPRDLSLVSTRPLMEQTLERMEKAEPRQFADWYPHIYCKMYPGAFSVFGTLVAHKFQSKNCPEYYRASMTSDEWYFNNGCEEVDMAIINLTVMAGAWRMTHALRSIREQLDRGSIRSLKPGHITSASGVFAPFAPHGMSPA